MPIYRQDIKLYATVYVRADDADDAAGKIAGLHLQALEFFDDAGANDVPISDKGYTDPELPDISLSPAMTIHGPDVGSIPELVE
jgi:hypothetical protein